MPGAVVAVSVEPGDTVKCLPLLFIRIQVQNIPVWYIPWNIPRHAIRYAFYV